jgi:hypothetical protein
VKGHQTARLDLKESAGEIKTCILYVSFISTLLDSRGDDETTYFLYIGESSFDEDEEDDEYLVLRLVRCFDVAEDIIYFAERESHPFSEHIHP